MRKHLLHLIVGLAVGVTTHCNSQAQAVNVTIRFDTNSLAVGSTTTLHVLAQIASTQRSQADQIFSWYVDLMSVSPKIASADYSKLQRPASDADPLTSSSGTAEGANRRGIYDTFLNHPNAGRDLPVELFSVPVTALAEGHATFAVQAGTGVTQLSWDFIVAPTGLGVPLLGGDYSNATADLSVTGAGSAPRLQITRNPSSSGQQRVTLTFTPVLGKANVVEFRNILGSGPDWQSLPGAPHNTGIVTDTNQAPQSFYRLRVN